MPRARPRVRWRLGACRRQARTAGSTAVIAVVLSVSSAAAEVPRPGTFGTRMGSHSMLYLNSSRAGQKALFAAARDAGVKYLRMDITMGAIFGWGGRRDFSALTRIDRLAAQYHLTIDGVLTGPRGWMTDCPPGTTVERAETCPLRADQESAWFGMVTATVARAPHVRYWELFNEANNPWMYAWTPAQYARIATLTAGAIRSGRPNAKVVLGGPSRLDTVWLRSVMHDRANPLIGVIDVANVHLRGNADRMYALASAADRFFRDLGFDGPLWITETGYPSLPRHQWDPAYHTGDHSQKAYLRRLVPNLLRGGVDAAFVTLRDGPEFGRTSPFASEGIVRWPRLTTAGRVVTKPAFATVKRLAATELPSQ
jgi:hypothetical protein